MENLKIEATSSSPFVLFNYESNLLEIRGESYPENTSEFYHPIFQWLEEYIGQLPNETKATLSLELIYFNSSSSKVLLDLFDMLEEAVEGGKQFEVIWYYDEENEMALEYGEEFQEDMEALPFQVVPKDGDSE